MHSPIRQERAQELNKIVDNQGSITLQELIKTLESYFRPQQGKTRFLGVGLSRSHSELSSINLIIFNLLEKIFKKYMQSEIIQTDMDNIMLAFKDYFFDKKSKNPHHQKKTAGDHLKPQSVTTTSRNALNILIEKLEIQLNDHAKLKQTLDLAKKKLQQNQANFKKNLANIVNFYLDDNNYQVAKGKFFRTPRQLLLYSNLWRKNRLYRFHKKTSKNAQSHIPQNRTNELLVNLINRLVFTHKNYIHALQKLIQTNDDREDFSTQLIFFLHGIFDDIQNNFFKNLRTKYQQKLVDKHSKIFMHYRQKILQLINHHKIDDLDISLQAFCNAVLNHKDIVTTKKALLNFTSEENKAILAEILDELANDLRSAKPHITEKYFARLKSLTNSTNEATLKQQITQYWQAYLFADIEARNAAKANIIELFEHKFQKEVKRLLLGMSNELFDIKKELVADRKQIDNDLKEIKKCINRIAQDQGIGLHVAKRVTTTPNEDSLEQYFQPTYCPYTAQATLIRQQKQRDRQVKSQNKRIAKVSAFGLAIGEGGVAGSGMYSLLAALSIPFSVSFGLTLGIVIFAGGAFCNYFLVRDDTSSVLNKLRRKIWAKKQNGSYDYVRAIWVNQEGIEISIYKKVAICIFGLASFGGGFSYGVLSATSLFAGILKPFLLKIGAGALAATIVGGTLAFIPVTFTAIALTSIFFVVISDIIVNERWNDVYHYFKRGIDCVRAMDWRFKNGAFFKSLSKTLSLFIFNAIKLTIGLALNILFTVASIGMFHAKGVEVLQLITSLNKASIIALSFAAANGFANFFFGVEKVNRIFSRITPKKAIVGLCSLPFVIATLAVAGSECIVRFAGKTLIEFAAFLCPFKKLKAQIKTFSDNTSFRANFTSFTTKTIIKFSHKISKSIKRFCKNLINKNKSDAHRIELPTIKTDHNNTTKTKSNPINNTLMMDQKKSQEIIQSLQAQKEKVQQAIGALAIEGNAEGQAAMVGNTPEAHKTIMTTILLTVGYKTSNLTEGVLAATAAYVFSKFSNELAYLACSKTTHVNQVSHTPSTNPLSFFKKAVEITQTDKAETNPNPKPTRFATNPGS